MAQFVEKPTLFKTWNQLGGFGFFEITMSWGHITLKIIKLNKIFSVKQFC